MKNRFEQIILVIPSFCPPIDFPAFVLELGRLGFSRIVIVNDGSPTHFDEVFQSIDGAVIIVNEMNRGKGYSIKKGCKYAIDNLKNFSHILMCDDDGQHIASDVAKLASNALNISGPIFIGSRSFDNKVPLRSLFGNLFMRMLFKVLTGKKIQDTQSGLRCIPVEYCQSIIKITETRFSFETIALSVFIRKGYPVVEIPISTIYFNKNKGSRFLTIKDSVDVVWGMIKNFFCP